MGTLAGAAVYPVQDVEAAFVGGEGGAMRARVAVVMAIVGFVLVVTEAPALAKGADQATITGPGLAKAIVLAGFGEPGTGDKLARLSEGSGLFAAMFDGAGQLNATGPVEALGPRFSLTYRVPTGAKEAATVKQDLYPAAAGGPLTFTAAGQETFPGNRTTGGWYRAPDWFAVLLTELKVPGVNLHGGAKPLPVVAVSLPAPPASAAAAASAEPEAPAPARSSPALLLGLGALVVVGLAAGGTVLMKRHRAG